MAESEAIIQRNMQHKGRIVEAGTHEVLVNRAQGPYAHLWRMQDGVRASAQP